MKVWSQARPRFIDLETIGVYDVIKEETQTNKKRMLGIFLVTFISFSIVPIYANSSWYWLTDSPLTLLPIAVVATLLIETVIIVVVNKIKYPGSLKTAVVIALANCVSFLTPYVVSGINENESYPSLGFYGALTKYVSENPAYLIGFSFFLLTMFIETPIIYYYLVLKLNVKNKKALLLSIIVANVITTVIVFLLEHALFFGEYLYV